MPAVEVVRSAERATPTTRSRLRVPISSRGKPTMLSESPTTEEHAAHWNTSGASSWRRRWHGSRGWVGEGSNTGGHAASHAHLHSKSRSE